MRDTKRVTKLLVVAVVKPRPDQYRGARRERVGRWRSSLSPCAAARSVLNCTSPPAHSFHSPRHCLVVQSLGQYRHLVAAA
eukprot:1550865-Rhodomonas_salina.5